MPGNPEGFTGHFYGLTACPDFSGASSDHENFTSSDDGISR